MENLINTYQDAFKAVFLLGKFDSVQAMKVFIPIAMVVASVIVGFGHIDKF